jgi:hypothetical protein
MADLVPTDDGRTPSPSELAGAVFAIQPDLNDRLVEAINEIADIANQDCYGSGPVKEPCDCETCAAKRAIAVLNRVRLPVVRSLRPDRLNYCERVFFDAWVKQNTRMGGINGGYGTLELILRPNRVNDESVNYLQSPAFVSQRDMDVATTVVQWLGTNCGQSFIWQCEQEWKARRAERSEFESVTHVAKSWSEYREKPTYKRIADSIAEKYAKDDRLRESLSVEICKAMLYAKAKAETDAFETVAQAAAI